MVRFCRCLHSCVGGPGCRVCGCQWLGGRGDVAGRWGACFSWFCAVSGCLGELVEVIGCIKGSGGMHSGGRTDFVTTNCEYDIRYGIIFSLYIGDYGLAAHIYKLARIQYLVYVNHT